MRTQRVWEALADGPRTSSEIANELDERTRDVSDALKNLRERHLVRLNDGLWARVPGANPTFGVAPGGSVRWDYANPVQVELQRIFATWGTK